MNAPDTRSLDTHPPFPYSFSLIRILDTYKLFPPNFTRCFFSRVIGHQCGGRRALTHEVNCEFQIGLDRPGDDRS